MIVAWRLRGPVLRLLVAGAGLALGCASQPPAPPPGSAQPSAPPTAEPAVRSRVPLAAAPSRASRTVELGRSVRGRPIEAVVFEGGSRCVLILGGIHGSEPSSADLAGRLVEHLKGRPQDLAGKRVLVIPRANPDGLAAGTRWNARGVDLNRNFATDNFEPCARNGLAALSEPESRALVRAIALYRPSCVVSVHAPLNCIDADGVDASYALAREMARVSPLPVNDLPAMPGSLGSYAGDELGLKMITYELDRKKTPGNSPAAYLDSHLPALLAAIGRG